MNELDSTLAALAEPTRRQVVELLRKGPRRASQLAAGVGASAPAMSRHLRVLRLSGLVSERRIENDARVHLYVLRPEPFATLQAWLAQVQAFWTDQLEAYREHVERTTTGGHQS